jgi:tagaturonate epimerase
MILEKYSLGIGDRFGMEGVAQLHAIQQAEERGVLVVPVWNKSNREHSLIGTQPDDVRAAADDAVRATGWRHAYYVDADHIGVKTVDRFIASSNFFTLDVADFIGQSADDRAIESFVRDMEPFCGTLRIPGVDAAFEVTEPILREIGRRYVCAAAEAGRTYRRIEAAKGAAPFVTEVSIDEASESQSPLELFFVLGALARERIPAQTVAPKFSGKFLKGIDYVGDPRIFAREFEADLAVVRHAIDVFGLPPSLKLSVHTGSDKFSLYPIMRAALRKADQGLHLKTAGTTWLEEIVGVTLSGPAGLDLAKRIYAAAFARYDELCAPYATVVAIDRAKLPAPSEVSTFGAERLADLIRHDPFCADFSIHVRQLMHVAFKIAAELGEEFRAALRGGRQTVAPCVTRNLQRHIDPLFGRN